MRREEENKPSCSMIAVSRKRDVSEIGDNQAAQDEEYAKCRFQRERVLAKDRGGETCHDWRQVREQGCLGGSDSAACEAPQDKCHSRTEDAEKGEVEQV